MSFLDNGEECRSLVLVELVFSSELQSVVVQIEQYFIKMVLVAHGDVENVRQLTTTSKYLHVIRPPLHGAPKSVAAYR